MGKTIIILIGLLFLIAVFVFAWYFYTNGYSLPKKYRIKSSYYENGEEYHIIQWKAFFHWHNYLLDSYYMDYADFSSKDEAYEWLESMNKSNNCIKEEVSEVIL